MTRIKGPPDVKRAARVAPETARDTAFDNAESTRSRSAFQGRCICCLSPVAQARHQYCRTCRSWMRFANALAVTRATRKARELVL